MDTITLQKLTVVYDLVEALRARDNWCGETHVQKSMYFLEHLSGHALEYDYILYKHGPYSFGLSEDIASMKSLRFLDEVIAHPNYGPRLKNNPEAGTMLRKNFGEKARDLNERLTFVADKLCVYGVATLERLATALYFTRQQIVNDQSVRARRISEVKPHISVTLAAEAVAIVESILAEWDARHSAREVAGAAPCAG